MMKNESNVIYIDSTQIKDNLTKKLNSIEEFSDEDFFVEKKINNLLNRLDLLEDNYWKNFTKTTIDFLKKFGYAIVKGLPFDDNNRLHAALANTIGNPIRHHSGIKSLVREITPRAGDNPLENFPHTDSPHFPVPNDLITLQCGREDQHIDVYSRIVHIDPVLDELKKDHSSLIKKFSEHKYPFNLQKDFGDAGYQMQPFLTSKKYSGKSETHVRFCRGDSEHSIECCNLHIDKEDINDMFIFEQIATKIGEETQFLFKKDDWLIFDNKKMFHSKTKTSPDTIRMLKKIKLNINREHF